MIYCVYLINLEGTNTYKIGYTNKNKGPEGRLKELQTGCPYKLKVIHSFESEYGNKIEGIMHRHHSLNKVDEDDNELLGEWFELSSDEVGYFLKNCENTDEMIKMLVETSTLSDPLKYL